jgi:hypothetical protein
MVLDALAWFILIHNDLVGHCREQAAINKLPGYGLRPIRQFANSH